MALAGTSNVIDNLGRRPSIPHSLPNDPKSLRKHVPTSPTTPHCAPPLPHEHDTHDTQPTIPLPTSHDHFAHPLHASSHPALFRPRRAPFRQARRYPPKARRRDWRAGKHLHLRQPPPRCPRNQAKAVGAAGRRNPRPERRARGHARGE